MSKKTQDSGIITEYRANSADAGLSDCASDDLFEGIPEGTRIVISGNRVTFENLTPELTDVADAVSGKKRGE